MTAASAPAGAPAQAPSAEPAPWFDERIFAPSAREVLLSAAALAAEGGGAVGAAHVACALFCGHTLGEACLAMLPAADADALRQELRTRAAASDRALLVGEAQIQTDFFMRCVRAQRPSFGPKNVEDLVLSVLEPAFSLMPVFAQYGLTVEVIRSSLPAAFAGAVAHTEGQGQGAKSQQLPAPSPAIAAAPGAPKKPITNPGGIAAKFAKKSTGKEDQPSALASFGVDMVAQARAGRLDPVVGRDDEVARVLRILARRTKNNVCLVGAPGVGKTAVAEGIAQRIASGQVPKQLHKCTQLWSVDIGALLAGTSLRGDFEERIRSLLAEVRASDGGIILFIDELHLILGAGKSEGGNVDAANLLKPALARGELRCIGATTTDEYQRLILTKDAAFERRFQPVELSEPTADATILMLRALAPRYAAHHRIAIAADAVEAAVLLSQRCIHGRRLPDKAIDVMDEACCAATAKGMAEVTREHVEGVVRQWRAPSWQRERGPLGRFLSRLQSRSRL